MTTVDRRTNETNIRVQLLADTSATRISTTAPFLDHMLTTLARYWGVGILLEANGDLKHHIIEDTAIALGEALAAFRPERAARYGERTVPMDDALVQCALDIGGRSFYEGPLPSTMYDHWMRSFAQHARTTLHIRVLRGTDRHHIVEAAFKALGLALRDAFVEGEAVFSTKGAVSLSIEP